MLTGSLLPHLFWLFLIVSIKFVVRNFFLTFSLLNPEHFFFNLCFMFFKTQISCTLFWVLAWEEVLLFSLCREVREVGTKVNSHTTVFLKPYTHSKRGMESLTKNIYPWQPRGSSLSPLNDTHMSSSLSLTYNHRSLSLSCIRLICC